MKYILLHIGQYFIMISKVFSFPEKKKIFFKQFNLELEKTGLNSLGIVTIISFFIGAVVSIQTAFNFESPLYPKYLIGYATRESLILEFCPTMLALILAGKVGSNIASEIGSMRVTEQIDALESLSLDPIAYLVFPRVFAGFIMFPVLIIIADVFGISGGVFAAATSLDIDTYQFMKGFKTWFKPWDAWYGIIKGLSFGMAITSISCFYGFYTRGGAAGVGKSTTSSVVVSCVAIMLLDYILAALLL